MTSFRRGKYAAFALILVLLLSACIRVEQDIVIDDNGSGEVNMIVAVDTEAFGQLAELGDGDVPVGDLGSDAICDGFTDELANDGFDDLASGLDDPPRISDYSDGNFCGLELSFELPESDDHAQTLSGMFDEIQLERVGDGWVFDAVLPDQDDGDLGGDLGADLGAGGDLDGLEALFDGFGYQLSVELPGEATEGEHNATSVDGGRFVWEFDLLNPPDRVFASTQPAGFSFPWALLFGLFIIGLVIYGVYWFFTNEEAQEGTSLQESLTGGQQPQDPQDPSQVYTQTASATAGAGHPHHETHQQMAATTTAAAATATLEPVYDESIGAWVVYHPEQGRMRHDPTTDQWVQG